MRKELFKSKTFWTGISAIVAAVGGYLSGQMGIETAIQTGIGGVAAITLRDSIEKIR